ncbi:MAG: hypothetical protein CSA33_07905 [Desulfobulbus propionicus]|nr:MAG: hypothetical protein CSA33_07905 [Desulfobulbus propionicus]
MNIALTTDGSTLDSTVFYEFAGAPWLLIVNVDTMECTAIAHVVAPGSDEDMARKILEYRCEAVMTGKLTEKAFNILADEGVTRYAAAGMGVRKALAAMDNRELRFIRNPEGTDSCQGWHHH